LREKEKDPTALEHTCFATCRLKAPKGILLVLNFQKQIFCGGMTRKRVLWFDSTDPQHKKKPDELLKTQMYLKHPKSVDAPDGKTTNLQSGREKKPFVFKFEGKPEFTRPRSK